MTTTAPRSPENRAQWLVAKATVGFGTQWRDEEFLA